MRRLRATFRLLGVALLGAALLGAGVSAASAQTRPAPAVDGQDAFQSFLVSRWPEAQARGISRATFDAALRGVSLDPKVLALTKKQSEFVQPIWGYVDSAASSARLQRGREMTGRFSAALDAIERAYGVPRAIVLGVWGMETNFGSFTGGFPVIRSLATLAFARYRGDFFRDELLTALQILEQDHIRNEEMRGSWAGAMGQTQFMPSSFVKFAVDGDGDGRRDIWTSERDALASTANFLRQHGWQPGLPWGFEVELPEGFDFRHHRQGFSSWAGLGLRRADGGALPRSGEATLFLPGGARGPAFLITDNFTVIKAYNSSDAYALGVAHLGDRLMGGPAIRGEWPRGEPVLSAAQRQEVQKRLAARGLYSGDADGKLGSKTREGLRAFQLQQGLVADGYANFESLQALRAAR